MCSKLEYPPRQHFPLFVNPSPDHHPPPFSRLHVYTFNYTIYRISESGVCNVSLKNPPCGAQNVLKKKTIYAILFYSYLKFSYFFLDLGK